MKILKYELIDQQTLLASLQQTRLMGHGQYSIYRNATLSLQEAVDPNILVPAQRYVLESDFRRIESLYKSFLRADIDIFSLTGGLWFWQEESDAGEAEGPIPLTPPIVEESFESGGKKIWLISDGMHRVYTARKLGKRINIILVQNVPEIYPYYAYPLTQGWEEVMELTTLPDDFQKKTYREENYKALFRNYNEVLPGIQKQRKRTNPLLSD
jgi:hypothetical protein